MPKPDEKNNAFTSKWRYRCHYAGGLWQLNKMAFNRCGIEMDPEIPPLSQCEDVPCILTVRSYIYSYFMETNAIYGGIPYSKAIYGCYGCIEAAFSKWNPCSDLIIILISKKLIAAAKWESGRMVSSFACDFTSKHLNGVDDMMTILDSNYQKWTTECYCPVLVRCPEEFKEAIFRMYRSSSYMTHVPFQTAKPSVDELKRVFKKVSAVKKFQSITAATKDFEARGRGKRAAAKNVEEKERKASKANLRSQRQNFPDINKKTQTALFKALESGNGDELFALVHEIKHNDQIRLFLNTAHTALNGDTFLHFAARNLFENVVQILLEIGCDPTVNNCDETVPYEICKNRSIQKIFIDYRNQNPEGLNWNLAKIPTELSSDPTMERGEKEEDQEGFSLKNRKAKRRRSTKAEALYELKQR